MTQLSPAQAQNRHILAMLGVPLWVGRGQRTRHITVMGDRLGQKANPSAYVRPISPKNTAISTSYKENTTDIQSDKNTLIKQEVVTQEITTPIATPTQETQILEQLTKKVTLPKNDGLQDGAIANITNNKSLENNQPTTENPPKIPLFLDVRYRMEGVRYGNWALVVDLDKLDNETHAVWRSLCQSLQNQAQQTGAGYFMHSVGFPMIQNEYRQHQGLAPAQETFLGFMFRVAGLGGAVAVFLTELPQGIRYFGNVQKLPTLQELATHGELKKQFWQALMSQ